MSVPAKPSKERTAPRIVPRPTATSMARAHKPVAAAAAGGGGGVPGVRSSTSPQAARRSPPVRSAVSAPPPHAQLAPPPPHALPAPSPPPVQNPKFRPQSAPKYPYKNEKTSIKSRKALSPSPSTNACVAPAQPALNLIVDEQQPRELDMVSNAGDASPKLRTAESALSESSSTSELTATPDRIDELDGPQGLHEIDTIAEGEEPKIEAPAEVSLADKRKLFHKMKKDLDLKQEQLVSLYTSLKEAGEGAGVGEGGGEAGEGRGESAELVLLNVADWSAEELAQLWRNAAAAEFTDISNFTVKPDENYLTELHFRLSEVSACMVGVCQQALDNRDNVLVWAREVLGGSQEMADETQKTLNHFSTEGQSLMEMLIGMKTKAEKDVDTALELSKRAWLERGTLAAVGESLVRDVARLHARIEELQQQIAARPPLPSQPGDEAYEALSRELVEERAQAAALRDKLGSAETQLRSARVRINKMDRQLKEADTSLAALTLTVKTMEDQNRQRDVKFEGKARKAREAVKTSELSVCQITQQRDALELRVTELTEQQRAANEQHAASVAALRAELGALTSQLEEHKRDAEQEAELRRLAEQGLAAAANNVRDLKEQIADLERRVPNPEVPTERELAARAQTHAAQETLRLVEEQLAVATRDKARFLETLTKITEPGGEVTTQQKLAAELLAKEETVGKMQYQIRELTKNYKLNEKKVEQYERYLRDMQTFNVTAPDCSGELHDLQQEIISLRMSLVEMAHHNEGLTADLRQRELSLEQQERTAHSQTRVIKVRDELIGMLQNKDTAQSRELEVLQRDLEHRMLIVDEVNKQIATKADEIQNLFSTLECKQQEIHRREKIILALEEQLRRAQAQRTRQEEKIAALEHELMDSGERRGAHDKKFIFF